MSGDPSSEQAAARVEVMKCEKEIQSIKAALRRLGGAGNVDEPNSLEISVLKVREEGRLVLTYNFFCMGYSLIFLKIAHFTASFYRSKDCRRPRNRYFICSFPALSRRGLSVKYMIRAAPIPLQKDRWLRSRASKHPMQR